MDDLSQIISYYRRELKNSQIAIDYLKSRQLTPETINYFKLGYAPLNTKYNYEFLHRLIFPVKDTHGNYVAFTSRTIDPNSNEAKYKNSWESAEYQKGRILYGFADAFPYILESNSVFLVEGQFDFLQLWQNGVRNVVAGSGTGFTPIHARLLSRYCEFCYLSLDGDVAGTKAAPKVQRYLEEVGLVVVKGNLPNGLDPDEMVRNFGIDKFLACFS